MTTPAFGSDVFTWPVIGPALRWKHARTALQLVLLAVAALMVLHGLVDAAGTGEPGHRPDVECTTAGC